MNSTFSCCERSETFVSHVTLLVKDPTPSAMLSLRFQFSALLPRWSKRVLIMRLKMSSTTTPMPPQWLDPKFNGLLGRLRNSMWSHYMLLLMFVCHKILQLWTLIVGHVFAFIHFIYFDSKLFLQPFVSLTFAFDYYYKE
jgi:hypothetical protein